MSRCTVQVSNVALGTTVVEIRGCNGDSIEDVAAVATVWQVEKMF
jgi:hypothetical protein